QHICRRRGQKRAGRLRSPPARCQPGTCPVSPRRNRQSDGSWPELSAEQLSAQPEKCGPRGLFSTRLAIARKIGSVQWRAESQAAPERPAERPGPPSAFVLFWRGEACLTIARFGHLSSRAPSRRFAAYAVVGTHTKTRSLLRWPPVL